MRILGNKTTLYLYQEWFSLAKQGRQCKYKSNNETRSRNNFCCGKAISISYFERVSVALAI